MSKEHVPDFGKEDKQYVEIYSKARKEGYIEGLKFASKFFRENNSPLMLRFKQIIKEQENE